MKNRYVTRIYRENAIEIGPQGFGSQWRILYEIGKYGRLRLDFIKKHRQGTYTTLLTEGRLNEHLHNIDEQVREQVDLLIVQTAERLNLTEDFKTSNPLRWVQIMNDIKASAEGIVLREVIFR